MPKERKNRSVSHEKYRRGLQPVCRGTLKPSEKQVKEWEEARCPVCIEHPHNGILLICSSYDNGCRPYMCDTSHRHSNCFDQFRKASKEGQVVATLTCPLCRGHIKEWVVVEPARCFMNSKLRSCSSETCIFSGCYSDLRKHARVQHPGLRPSEVDPERRRSWNRLERERDVGDLHSTLDSLFGGEETSSSNDDEEIVRTINDIDFLEFRVVFLIGVTSIIRSTGSSSSRWLSRSEVGVRRSSRLSGEGYEENNNQSSDEQESSDDQESRTQRRQARRRNFIVDDDDEDDDEEP